LKRLRKKRAYDEGAENDERRRLAGKAQREVGAARLGVVSELKLRPPKNRERSLVASLCRDDSERQRRGQSRPQESNAVSAGGFQVTLPDAASVKAQDVFSRFLAHEQLQRSFYDFAFRFEAGELSRLAD